MRHSSVPKLRIITSQSALSASCFFLWPHLNFFNSKATDLFEPKVIVVVSENSDTKLTDDVSMMDGVSTVTYTVVNQILEQ